MKTIPQIKPKIGKNEINAVKSYMASDGWLTEYEETEKFESMICKFLNVEYCSATTSGTMALILTLMANDIDVDDQVIVPAMSMVATAYAVSFLKARPVFCNIDRNLCLDIEEMKKIMDKTYIKAVIYVSFNGRSGNMNKLVKECKRRNIPLIEDSCQAFGSMYKNKYLGTFGKCGCFSFSPHKIITTGQGGAVVTNDKELYNKIEKLKDFGRLKGGNDYHSSFGINAKFTDLQAVVGIEQIKTIKEKIEKKKQIYRLYQKYLSNCKKIKFIKTDLNNVTPWVTDIYIDDDNYNFAIKDYLQDKNIEIRLIYPLMNRQPYYKRFYECEKSAVFVKGGLFLPSYVDLTEKDIQYICETIKLYLE